MSFPALSRRRLPAFVVRVALLALLAAPAVALDPAKRLTQFTHRSWLAEHGIGEVFSIAQTTDGYLWLATSNGTFRFDGIRFSRLAGAEPESTRAGAIPYHVLGSRDGSLWISRGETVARLRGGQQTVYSDADGLPGGLVDSIREENDGAVWVAAASGIARFADERWQTFGAGQGLPVGPPRTTLLDRQQNLWTIAFELTPPSSRHRVYRLRPGETTFQAVGDGEAETHMLAEAPDGRIWAAQWPRREVRPLVVGPSTVRFAGPTISGISRHIRFDRDGALWIATMGDGLHRVSDTRTLGQLAGGASVEPTDTFTHRDGLSSDHVLCLFEGAEGEIWVGTSGGLDLFVENKFTSLSTREGLPFDQNLLLQPAAQEGIWAAASFQGFLKLVNPRRIDHLGWLNLVGGPFPTEITALYSDPSGDLLAGTSLGILSIRGDGTAVGNLPGTTARLGNVLALSRDREGALWICDDQSGVHRLHGDQLEHIPLWPEHTDRIATLCHTDAEGRIWIAVAGRWADAAALVCHDQGEIRWYSPQDGLLDGRILGMLNDAQGQLWVAGRGGLSRFRNGRFETLTREHGLPDDEVLALLEDDDGFFWLAGRTGIFRVARSALEDALAANPAGRVAGEMFAVKGGPRGYVRSVTGLRTRGFAAKAADGSLWFPTNAGVATIHPRRIPRNPVPPPVHIQHIVARGKSYRPERGLVLPERTRGCEFEYIGLCFTDPAEVRYRHKLEGHDEQWVEAGARRHAFYANLEPGTYRFRVQARNNDGVWNETGATAEFTIAAAFYEHAWFPLVWLVPTAFALWGLHRLRLARMAAQMNLRLASQALERKRIARELHDTLLQGFIGLGLKLDAIATNLPESLAPVRDQLRRILDQSDQYLTEARRSVMELRSASLEKGDDLAYALATAGERLTEGTGIQFTFGFEGVRRKLPLLVESNLLRIGEEALSNAVRHAQPTKVELHLKLGRREITLRIRDNGCGFDPHGPAGAKAGHFGLVGMQERVKAMAGRLVLTSQPGHGTLILVIVPAR